MRKVTEIQIDMGRTARKIETQQKLLGVVNQKLHELEAEAKQLATEYGDATAAQAEQYMAAITAKTGGR